MTPSCKSRSKKFPAWLLKKRRSTNMKKRMLAMKINPLDAVEAVAVVLVEAIVVVVEDPLVVAVVEP